MLFQVAPTILSASRWLLLHRFRVSVSRALATAAVRPQKSVSRGTSRGCRGRCAGGSGSRAPPWSADPLLGGTLMLNIAATSLSERRPPPFAKTHQVLLVDDHALCRMGMKALLVDS